MDFAALFPFLSPFQRTAVTTIILLYITTYYTWIFFLLLLLFLFSFCVDIFVRARQDQQGEDTSKKKWKAKYSINGRKKRFQTYKISH